MDLKKYNRIKAFCAKNLIKAHHARHLEDCIQHVAMKDWQYQGSQSWKHALIEYLRLNGIHSKNHKLGARALEQSLSIDMPSPGDDESNNSEYLLDQESISRSSQNDELIHFDDTKKGVLEEFLSPLNFNNEVMTWVTRSFKVKMK